MNSTENRLIVCTSDSGRTDIDVRFDADTACLTQQQIAELFGTSRTNVVEHLQHVYDEEELVRERTCRDFRQVRMEGNRRVARDIPHYNLDAIISVGYRVKSKVATQFRIWATQQLRDLLVQGYALNERRLDQLGAIVPVLGRASDELVAGVAEAPRSRSWSR